MSTFLHAPRTSLCQFILHRVSCECARQIATFTRKTGPAVSSTEEGCWLNALHLPEFTVVEVRRPAPAANRVVCIFAHLIWVPLKGVSDGQEGICDGAPEPEMVAQELPQCPAACYSANPRGLLDRTAITGIRRT